MIKLELVDGIAENGNLLLGLCLVQNNEIVQALAVLVEVGQ